MAGKSREVVKSIVNLKRELTTLDNVFRQKRNQKNYNENSDGVLSYSVSKAIEQLNDLSTKLLKYGGWY